jgi:uncharacterized protein (DUF983 family)
MAEQTKKPSVFASMVALKCPQCHKGDLFKKPGLYTISGMGDMYDRCPKCNLKYEQEPGFWWGSMYLNYGYSVAIVLPAFLLFKVIFGMSFYGSLVFAGAILTIMIPAVFRFGRSSWLYWFGKYKRLDK